MSLLAWSLAGAASIHIFEEFVFPVGFKSWWCAYRPEIAASVSNQFLIMINAVLLWPLCSSRTPFSISLGLSRPNVILRA